MSTDPRTISLGEMREFMGEFIKHNPVSGRFWDLITCLRGPDSPSERPDMLPEVASRAYEARRRRKAETVEVIRGLAFGGVVGGSARSRTDRDYVELPPEDEWDHFDKHVQRAAQAIGIEVRTRPKREGVKVEQVVKQKMKMKGWSEKLQETGPVMSTFKADPAPDAPLFWSTTTISEAQPLTLDMLQKAADKVTMKVPDDTVPPDLPHLWLGATLWVWDGEKKTFYRTTKKGLVLSVTLEALKEAKDGGEMSLYILVNGTYKTSGLMHHFYLLKEDRFKLLNLAAGDADVPF